MDSPSSRCPGCGNPLLAQSDIEGFCVRCLARSAWSAPGESFDAIGPWSLEPAAEPHRRMAGYELYEEIGRGGMGVVYRARQVGLDREVALKVLHLGPWATPGDRERFRREALAAAALRHPHVVTVYDVGEADGHAFLAMERIVGRTLADMVRVSPIEPDRAARYVQGVADAVAAAHAAGILHRDLKPANVLVDQNDQPRVTDFGLAKLLAPEGSGNPASGGAADPVTFSGQVLGTPGYLPPEQADPARGPVGFTSDVYALGALLYHLITGRPPFAGATLTATLAQVLNDDPAPPRRLNSAIPRDLETICLKCLQKDPDRRFPNAASVAEDLAAFRARRPIRARAVGFPEKAWLWCRRRPALASAMTGFVTVAVLGGTTALWQAAANRRNLYAADLRLASQAVEDGDLGRARELLDWHRPANGLADFAWRHLNHRSEGDARHVLGFHPWIVSSVAWSPDGRRLASGSVGSGTVGEDLRLWVVHPPTETGSYQVLTNRGARQLIWLTDSRRLLAAHSDGRIRLWDTDTGSVLEDWPGRSAGLSSDGRWLAVCEGDPFAWSKPFPSGAVRVHDRSGSGSFSPPLARLVAVSPTGDVVATTAFDDTIRLIPTVSDGPREPRVLTQAGDAWAMTFSPDGRILVATGFERDVRLWRLDETNSAPRRLSGHFGDTWGAAFASDGAWLATTASDQTICLWESASGRFLGRLRGHGNEVWCATFSPDGLQVATGSKDRSVVIWDNLVPDAEHTLEGRPLAPVVFSPDAGRLATWAAGNDGEVRIRIHELGSPRAGAPLPVPNGTPLAFAPESGELVAVEGFRLHEVNRAGAITEKVELEHDPGEEPPHVWASDARFQVVAGAAPGGFVSAWDVRSGRRRVRRLEPGLVSWRLTVSRDGRWLAVTAGEAGIRLAPTSIGEVRFLTGHADQAKDSAFSWDSRWLATASVDGTIRIWDVRTGQERATLRGHRTEVTTVAFAPDGLTLASGELEHGVRLWNLPTLREVAVLSIPDMGEWLGFSPDGRFLVIRLAGGRMRLLRTAP